MAVDDWRVGGRGKEGDKEGNFPVESLRRRPYERGGGRGEQTVSMPARRMEAAAAAAEEQSLQALSRIEKRIRVVGGGNYVMICN